MVRTIHYQYDPSSLAILSCRMDESFRAGDLIKIISKPMRCYYYWRIKRVIDQHNGFGLMDLEYPK